MQTVSASRTGSYAAGEIGATAEAVSSAVSWPAIIAGAFAAAALSLILLALGAGVGLSSVSPWQGSGASLTTFTVSAAIWLIVVQWLSSALGGYLAGRLRTKWVGVHDHEVFFRDTAHGLVTWAVATVVSAVLLASVVPSVLGGATHAVASVASGPQGTVSSGGSAADPMGYFVDTLFRSDHPSPAAPNQDLRGQASRLLVADIGDASVPNADKTYLATLVAARTGLSQADAQKRVDGVIAQVESAKVKAKKAADEARKAGARASFFMFFSLLIGAFIACTSAAIGGRQRHPF